MSVNVLWRSSVGKKAIMAVTGLVLLAYVTGHLMGNLLIFLGPGALNAYAERLHSLGLLLWIVRGILLAAVLTHLYVGVLLALENRQARPVAYQRKTHLETTYAARSMVYSGLMILAFIVFHILHFTVRLKHPELAHLHDATGRHDVYSMVVLSFRDGLTAAIYSTAVALLCFHLSHGIASIFQTLGLNSQRHLPVILAVGRTIAFLLFLGYISIPAAVFFGGLP